MADEDDSNQPPKAPKEEPAEERALALRPAEAAIQFRLADSLETAGRGTFVSIDRKGRVRSPLRYHALTGLYHGIYAGTILASTIIYVDLFGPLGGSVGVLLGTAFAVGLRRSHRLNQAAALIQADRLDEAETMCREILAGRFVPRRLRALAHQRLAAIATRRRQYELGLDHVRRAIQYRHSAFRRRDVEIDILRYAEVAILINLGRVGEARARFESLGEVPEGDFLRVQHWMASLYVQFAEARLQFEEDALWECSQAALRITGAAQLLALCSWGYSVRGDLDMSRHLLEQALDRAEPSAPATFPLLWKWVEERRQAFGIELPAPESE